MPNSSADWKIQRMIDEAIAAGNVKKVLAIRDLLSPPPKQPGPVADAPADSALTPDEAREILAAKKQMVSDYNVGQLMADYPDNIPRAAATRPDAPRLEPYHEPGWFDKFRDVLHANGKVQSALSPLFGLQYKDPRDAPRNIAGGVTELTGSPMAGEIADVAVQFIPGVAAIGAYDNGRIPGVLDFVGPMNPLKWTRTEKVLSGLSGGYDLFTRWLNSIPKRDNQ